MKNIFAILLSCAVPAASALAQGPPHGTEHLDPSAAWAGQAIFRTEFISYDTRQGAESGDPAGSKFYMPLPAEGTRQTAGGTLFSYTADLPYIWLDRDVYLQVSGLDSYYIYVGDDMIAYGEDSRMPMQFLVSGHITDGVNNISILHAPGEVSQIEALTGTGADAVPKVFLFSQPKVCIRDFRLRLWPDSTGSYGILNVRLAVSNSYNSPEEFTVGYDIYAPDGKLINYDIRQVALEGRSMDTVRFNEFIYNVNQNLWSPDNPRLYRGMVSVRRGGRMIEYIPFSIGYGKTETAHGRLLRGGVPVDLVPAEYNAEGDPAATRAELEKLKAQGVNTLLPSYPQPSWFYDLCDQIGFYVFDNANIAPVPSELGRMVQGALANRPEWLPRYLKRAETVRARSVNRASVVGISLGNDSGNGYNLYRTYLEVKSREIFRPVVYRFADGEWNTDMELPVP
ncbi:MAG: hypothetical protein LIO77_11230 [Rikenellaceae bacterium]|nr:hypothetical protein [Rikenellaceae bacterium]